ncbi:cell wall-binding repeat-containing protein [Clostridium sp. CX1]|uniref:cell wall-binding repeat-containing protein n=1 Tax=Clostridium sp. CX1 TaxID=2978346 RepID=UPI0021BEDEED|nr:cell wall-binding repeat-containing protein [Clostridium sp. CX1]MCT8975960.1 cell wall-binding repeat-containing protein [Clostridium sp. CX1]
MSKKGTRALASATLMSLVLTTALSAGPVQAAAGQATRLGEADRYATAAKVATSNWDKAETVVLVNGEGYADAVSGSALAKKLGAPILLTAGNALTTETKDALTKLGAKNVYVVGGNASVSAALRTELKASYTVTELGGANRYETNAAVAEELVKLGVDPANVMMVGGEGFSDALSVAPIAAAKGQILLLGMNDANYMKPVVDFVKKHNSKVTVVGTKGVINDTIYSAVGATSRVEGGADRWDTNQKVLAAFKETVKFDKLYVASASYNAKDNGFADALVASALAGKYAAPLVLVDKDGSTGTNNALDYIKKNASKTTDLNVVGGTGVVSESVLNAITNAVNPTTPVGDTTVKSIEATSLNQIKVVFGTDVDSDSAESVSNYKIDGATLSDSNAVATLGDDNRTLLITLKEAKEQHKEYTVSVKKGVLTADKINSVSEFEQKIEFVDITAPTLASVAVKGNSKITVKFSEPVRMEANAATTGAGITVRPANSLATYFKINGQNISSFGLDLANSEIKHAITTGTGSYVWSDEVDFYFTTKLPTGNSTLKVSDGKASDMLSDATNFIIKEVTQDFNVDAVTTKPTVKEVQADADGTLWVRFDRPMDSVTATRVGNYELNGAALAATKLELKEGDNTVKIKGVTGIQINSNTLYIKDNVKDAYGNKVDDDTRVSFTKVKDETKPTVTNVNMIDSETIRVRFSKDVLATDATKISNFTLKDSSGVDISDHIRLVKPSTTSVSDTTTAGAISQVGGDNVWDIKIWKNEGDYVRYGRSGSPTAQQTANDWRLTGSKYTLTIKGLRDTTGTGNTSANFMDEYTTTINGSDDIAPKMNVTSYRKDNQKIVLFFTEAMDTDTLNDLDNYKYKNASGDSKQLPSAAKITVGNDNKSVTIEFPSNYYVLGSSPSGTIDNDNWVYGIVASNLKDEAGNLIDSFNNYANVGSDAYMVSYKDKTYRMESDGDDLLVKFQYDKTIDPDTVAVDKFTVAGEQPDSVSIIGSDIVLRFVKDSPSTTTVMAGYSNVISGVDNAVENAKASDKRDVLDKIEVIKLQASQARVVVTDRTAATGVKDIAGTTVQAIGTVDVYDYLVAPKTTSDYWYATDVQTLADNVTTEAAVVISFDSMLYSNSGVRPDDFTFRANGEEIKADRVNVKGNSLVFHFVKGAALTDAARNSLIDTAFATGNTNGISVALKNTSIDVSSIKDGNGNYAKYVPSNDDKNKTRTVKVFNTVDIDNLK